MFIAPAPRASTHAAVCPAANTARQRDAKSAYENVYRDLARSYAGDKGTSLSIGQGLRSPEATPATKAGSACNELLIASDTLKKLIQEHARVADILRVSLEEACEP